MPVVLPASTSSMPFYTVAQPPLNAPTASLSTTAIMTPQTDRRQTIPFLHQNLLPINPALASPTPPSTMLTHAPTTMFSHAYNQTNLLSSHQSLKLTPPMARVYHLEDENQHLRANLQSTCNSLETAKEDLAAYKKKNQQKEKELKKTRDVNLSKGIKPV